MSGLDSFIRRLTAQRACFEKAFELIADVPGIVMELGLGNGRTFDHLRQNLPDRRIVVFEREPKAHPRCTPDAADLIIGDLNDQLPRTADQFKGKVALLHSDIGCGDPAIDANNARLIASQLPVLLSPMGIVLSDQPLQCDGFVEVSLPEGVQSGRYTFLVRHNDE